LVHKYARTEVRRNSFSVREWQSHGISCPERNQRSKKCPAVQKIAEERVEIVGCTKRKKIGMKNNPRRYST
jgi:hypothetical protein